MTEIWYPSLAHNSTAVTAEELELWGSIYAPSGVVGVPTDSPLAFGDSSGMAVKVAAGSALVQGGRYANSAVISLSITANSSGSTRYDLAVLRLDRAALDGPTVTAAVVTGTPGSGVPAPTQDAPGSGVWELPLASVEVASGAVTIAATDVKQIAWYVGEQVYVCTPTTRPPHKLGRLISDSTGVWVSNGTAWVLIGGGPSGSTSSATPTIATGWAAADINYVRRNNGWANFGLEVKRTGASLTAGTLSQVATIPGGYRPGVTVPLIGEAGGNAVAGRISSAGLVTLNAYGSSIGTGTYVYLQTASWDIGS